MGCNIVKNFKFIHVSLTFIAMFCAIVALRVDKHIFTLFRNKKDNIEEDVNNRDIRHDDDEGAYKGWLSLAIISFVFELGHCVWLTFGAQFQKKLLIWLYYIFLSILMGIATILSVIYFIYLFSLNYYDLTHHHNVTNHRNTTVRSSKGALTAKELEVEEQYNKYLTDHNLTPDHEISILSTAHIWIILVGMIFTLAAFVSYALPLILRRIKRTDDNAATVQQPTTTVDQQPPPPPQNNTPAIQNLNTETGEDSNAANLN